MEEPADFDAADLADAILGTEEPLPAPLTPPPAAGRSAGSAIGPFLIVALFLAVGLAIILAIAPEGTTEPDPCSGLYIDTAACCGDFDDCEPPCVTNWRNSNCEPQCEPRNDRRGLFDAEEEFAPGGEPWC